MTATISSHWHFAGRHMTLIFEALKKWQNRTKYKWPTSYSLIEPSAYYHIEFPFLFFISHVPRKQAAKINPRRAPALFHARWSPQIRCYQPNLNSGGKGLSGPCWCPRRRRPWHPCPCRCPWPSPPRWRTRSRRPSPPSPPAGPCPRPLSGSTSAWRPRRRARRVVETELPA